jgi:hypothetical protein
MDAFQAPTKSLAGNKYCDLIADLTNHWIHPVFTRNRTAEELVRAVSGFFNKHPELLRAGSLDRFIRCDPEPSYRSTEFVACLSSYGYAVEGTPPRDKHAGGIAERSIGLIISKANVSLFSAKPKKAPGAVWDFAIQYACMLSNIVQLLATAPTTSLPGVMSISNTSIPSGANVGYTSLLNSVTIRRLTHPAPTGLPCRIRVHDHRIQTILCGPGLRQRPYRKGPHVQRRCV